MKFTTAQTDGTYEAKTVQVEERGAMRDKNGGWEAHRALQMEALEMWEGRAHLSCVDGSTGVDRLHRLHRHLVLMALDLERDRRRHELGTPMETR